MPDLPPTADEVLEALYAHDGRPEPHDDDDILLTLLAAILSQATNRANADQAFDDLMTRFEGDLDAVRRAPDEDVAAAIAIGGLSAQKAPRIRGILETLHRERGELSMAHLRELEPEEARDALLRFDGVGPKTASFVLMWAAGMALFPMNSAILRLAVRLGWIAEGLSSAKAHATVEPMIPAAERFSAHVAMVRHGRLRCHARDPACEACPLRALCPAASAAVSG